jgi:D-glycero-D-manno-heptose 1,7-bisphosphate phosphatase
MKTVFLDRDGVICYNRSDHVKSWAEFRFLPGALPALAQLRAAGHRVVVITNQAVINRGQMTVAQVEEINRRMVAAVAAFGGRIDLVVYCPHRPDEGCACRKPRPGMVLAAGAHLGIHWEQTYLVGDHWTDVQAGLSAGCRTVLVLSGRGLRAFFSGEGRRTLRSTQGGYLVSRNLAHAVRHILRDEGTWPAGPARRVWQQVRDLGRAAPPPSVDAGHSMSAEGTLILQVDSNSLA